MQKLQRKKKNPEAPVTTIKDPNQFTSPNPNFAQNAHLMILRRTALLLTLFLSFSQVFAQSKLLDPESIATSKALVPTNLRQLAWVQNTDKYAYVDTVQGKDALIINNVSASEKPETISLFAIDAEMKNLGESEPKRFPAITWIKNGNFIFTQQDRVFEYDIKVKKLSAVTVLAEDADNTDIEPNTLAAAFTVDDNLYVSLNNMVNQVTKDGSRNIVYGHSVHREEFGIMKGTFWSPNGNLLAFYRMDQSMVTDYPIVDLTEKPAEDKPIKYPMAGGISHQVTIGIYNVKTKTVIYLNTGEPDDHYLTNISWSPDEKSIYVFELNRDQNDMKLNQYEAATGAFVKTLYEEKDDKYVQPLHPMYFVPGHKDEFVAQSRRDGWMQLYLYNMEGKLLRQLTKGNWETGSFLGFDEKGNTAYYTSNEQSPVDQDLYSVNLNDGKIERLTEGRGIHTPNMNENGKYFIDNLSSVNIPRTLTLKDTKGKDIKTLLIAANPLKDYNMGRTKIFTIKAADNTTPLYCRMIYPPGFDSAKKYPVIVYVYNGPGVQLVYNQWPTGTLLWLNYMAQLGYIVFTVDGRGSANRGAAFEQCTFRRLGTVELTDQLKGVEYLKSLKYTDTARFGVNGWSFGGFMTTSLMVRTPGTFKVGVAGGPVIDWRYYEVMYTERYMDTPDQNPDGYKTADLKNYVKNLRGHLILIHGTSDPVVVWQNSLSFIKKCVDEDVLIDYFVYPGHEHNVLGKDRGHLYKKMTQYYKDYL